MKVSNDILISTIRNFIHNEKELVPLLMSLLNLGKQSVYRRLRNEIPFTFEEVITLSTNIGFSVDGVMGQLNRGNKISETPYNNTQTVSENLYIESRNKMNLILENARKYKDSKVIVSSNRLPFIYTVAFENITKMEYYKWHHQQQDHFEEISFGDFKMPPGIISDGKSIVYNYTHINNHVLILDQNILKPIIKEIGYYYERGLVSEDEMDVLQKELLQIVDDLELLAIRGHYKSGSEISIYLSSLNIESNSILIEFEHSACFVVWVNTTEPVAIFNYNICSVQKKWLQSLKKYSTLITQCNDFSRSIFFKKQREFIMKMKDEKEVYL